MKFGFVSVRGASMAVKDVENFAIRKLIAGSFGLCINIASLV